LLFGNSKVKVIDPDISILIDKGESSGKLVTDFFTKKSRFVSIEIEKASKLYDTMNFLRARDPNSKIYAPSPEHLPLLPEYEYLMQSVIQTKPIKMATVDIEVNTAGLDFFSPLTSPIVSIAVKFNDDPPICIYQYDNERTDYYILKEFIRLIKIFDPDILTVYNAKYDIPFILIRLALHGIQANLSRSKNPFQGKSAEKLFFYFNGIKKDRTLRDILPGRIIYDVAQDAFKDQTLNGNVKNRKLKTVAEYYGIKGLKLENNDFQNMKQLIRTKKLIEYNKSDVETTYQLAKQRYFPVAREVAKLMNLPIGNTLNAPPSYMPETFSMRELRKRNIYPFELNKDRYDRYSKLMNKERDIASDKNTVSYDEDDDFIDLDTNDWISKKFRAAICYQSPKLVGYIEKVMKYDFSGYYPSAIMTLNLGPDTTKLVEFRTRRNINDITSEWLNSQTMRLYIQDISWDIEAVIDVDMSYTSFYKKKLIECKTMRDQIKKELANTKDEDKKNILDAMQYAIKVVMNVFFGASAQTYALYEDTSVALAIVGATRDATNYICDNLFTYEHIIEIDTDGIYTNKKFDINELNKAVQNYVLNTHKISECHMKLDEEEFGAAFFLKKKNYVIEVPSKGNELKFVGSLKSANRPILFDKAKYRVANAIIKDKSKDIYNIVCEISDLEQYIWPNEFVFTVKTKPKDAYSLGSHMYKLITQYEKYEPVGHSNLLEYVYTLKGVKPAHLVSKDDKYDYKIYSKQITSLIKLFKLEEVMKTGNSLF